MSALLPIASAREVRAQARRIALRHRPALVGALSLHTLAAASGLVAPRLLGELVGRVSQGATAQGAVVLIAVFVVAQSVLLAAAVYASARLGENVLAELREEFVDNVLALPLGTVERAGTGDLVNRTTRDVDLLSRAVRQAVPDTMFAGTSIVLTMGALLLVDPLLALPCLVAVPLLWAAARWYLRRARDGYLRQSASYARITDGLTATAEGARTVEALRIAGRRTARADADIAETYRAERYTLRLRTVFLPISDFAYVLPVAATLVVGGLFYLDGLVTLAAVTAATLYVQQVIAPVDVLLYWMNELQVGGASLARTLGVRGSTPATRAAATLSDGGRVTVEGVSYAYREGRPVLHDVTLSVEPGERLAIVGPSGAGKSTLGRLLAGINEPSTGSVTVGGAPLSGLPIDALRRRVALVTQEHYVFAGTLRDNLRMAKPAATDDELERTLKALDAWDWSAALEAGLDTPVGAGGLALSPSQAQQLALARLALADPQVLILDEATSLLAPRAAREVERSLAAVLQGRTVIAIAHRLHTAHAADRIAVLEHGRVVELGPHDDLVRAGGPYAALWRSWHGVV